MTGVHDSQVRSLKSKTGGCFGNVAGIISNKFLIFKFLLTNSNWDSFIRVQVRVRGLALNQIAVFRKTGVLRGAFSMAEIERKITPSGSSKKSYLLCFGLYFFQVIIQMHKLHIYTFFTIIECFFKNAS